MHYSSGNYEAFVKPRKPAGVEEKSAYIIGTGLAGLSAACFLVRDGQMAGSRIHILESDPIPGGACDGIKDPHKGYIMRGGREMDNHFECMWDLYRSIPSIEHPGESVLDEYYYLNTDDPNYSLCRATYDKGKDAHTDGKFTLSEKGSMEIMKLFLTPDEQLANKTLNDVFDDEVYNSNFWLYWQTMFAFEKWHSALEMKLYIQRFVHHVGGLPDFKALRFTKYNQYDSMILPMVNYLQKAGVDFQYGIRVTNVILSKTAGKKVVNSIQYLKDGKPQQLSLTEKDLVFVTNGSCTESSATGDQDHAPVIKVKDGEGESWALWKNIARQDASFGHPDKFCTDIAKTKWESATVETLDDTILPYIKNICKRDPLSGKVTTGGIVTVKDSSWLMSWTINRQPQFKDQPDGHVLVWVYGLYPERNGDYVKKPMEQCSGAEICEEWLYHMGVPEDKIVEYATKHAHTIPVMMPYITAFFMPREAGDRPEVVPAGCVNLAFIGQFANTRRDCVFTTEYSIRTGMEAVYTLLDIERGVPEVWGSVYDVRSLLDATSKLSDGKKVTDMKLPFPLKIVEKKGLKKIEGTLIETMLKRYHLI